MPTQQQLKEAPTSIEITNSSKLIDKRFREYLMALLLGATLSQIDPIYKLLEKK